MQRGAIHKSLFADYKHEHPSTVEVTNIEDNNNNDNTGEKQILVYVDVEDFDSNGFNPHICNAESMEKNLTHYKHCFNDICCESTKSEKFSDYRFNIENCKNDKNSIFNEKISYDKVFKNEIEADEQELFFRNCTYYRYKTKEENIVFNALTDYAPQDETKDPSSADHDVSETPVTPDYKGFDEEWNGETDVFNTNEFSDESDQATFNENPKYDWEYVNSTHSTKRRLIDNDIVALKNNSSLFPDNNNISREITYEDDVTIDSLNNLSMASSASRISSTIGPSCIVLSLGLYLLTVSSRKSKILGGFCIIACFLFVAVFY